MQYTITEINNGTATVQFEDGTFMFVELTDGMTEEDFDDLIFSAAPPQLKGGGTAPSWIAEGQQRIAAIKPEPETTPPADWLIARQGAYVNLDEQIEYITENGLEAWQAKVAQIKADFPKS